MFKTILEAKNNIIRQLTQAGVSNADLEANIILCEVTGKDTARLILDQSTTLDDDSLARLQSMLEARCRRVPLAHILGYAEFYGYRFITRPGVLIPRKETEILVEEFLRTNIPHGSTILDLACGSGCIGLTVAKERLDLKVHLSDISEAAISQTSENATALSIQNVKVIQSNWFESIPVNPVGVEAPGNPEIENYYAILTNPPYINLVESALMEPEVLNHEPHIALFHESPVDLYASILTEAHARLSGPGILMAELSPFIADAILSLAGKKFSSARLIKDYSGHNRILLARKND